MSFPRILVVDEQAAVRRLLEVSLRANGYWVADASTAHDALRLAPALHPDLVILDLDLPDLDGTALVRLLRKWTRVPILVLSAREKEADVVAALDAGADDYLTKPSRDAELMARLRALLRRASSQPDEPLFLGGDLSIDLPTREIRLAGQPVFLTPTEYEVLRTLALNADRVVTHRELIREVWGGSHHEDALHLLRVNVSNLRRKLGPQYILTQAGIGYRLRTEPAERRLSAAG